MTNSEFMLRGRIENIQKATTKSTFQVIWFNLWVKDETINRERFFQMEYISDSIDANEGDTVIIRGSLICGYDRGRAIMCVNSVSNKNVNY